MLQVLRRGDVEVRQAAEPFTADGVEYAAGSHVIFTGQPFGSYRQDAT
ncbi:MAG: hypothetical protein R3A46_07780 [Thermomicrobiales bacterium]